ncbi:vWA domain-containing protein [Aureibacillus halotolerans]|uniref:Ca-activated chloride channel family protein n=1 Tax=Aureibacillus halotolerans TaxID=1508390 RepID=A0A4R6U9A9_9BACI|nr:VWA domain-containing protein [Aureibacillus halotolerans]TDQ43031.1 Ca-activated chloride channel family protein [Aureibacillus halotolerans]
MPWTIRNALFLLLLLVISACSNNTEVKETTGAESSTTKSSESTKGEQEDIDKLDYHNITMFPEGIDDVLAYPTSPFAGETFKENSEAIKAELDNFPKLTEEASEEETNAYFKRLIALFVEDYPGPEEVTEDWDFTYPDPPTTSDGLQLKPHLNVEIILDASGSMAEEVNGQPKMELAKGAIDNFASQLPDEANVGLRVYGHKGTTAFADKIGSCQSSELFYEIQSYESKTLETALEGFQPAGWTPIAQAIKDAKKDLQAFDGEENTNLIFLVSDGKGTCDKDPVQAAEELMDSNIQPIVNVIGFDVDEEGEQQLKSIAEATGGIYALVQHEEALQKQFERAREIADQWKAWHSEARHYLHDEFGRQKEDVSKMRATWKENFNRESDTIVSALDYLEESTIIDGDSRGALWEMNLDRVLLLGDIGRIEAGQIYDRANKAFDQNFDEVEAKKENNSIR